jgi:indolepyruvate ferredoxin oxidoreductase
MASVSLALTRHDVRLEDRYDAAAGRVFLSGVQALVRLLLDQSTADALAGSRVGTFVSGYQGSPLGGFDRELAGLGERAATAGIVHRPGVNEELGATSVWGSQIATTLPGARYDGVLGVWYGKAPGVDRAADALRHGNFVGADPRGGLIALCGDDPASKSSTLPSASEPILAALHMPVVAPSSVQELLDLGRHAIAASRACGLWTAVKVSTALADATATVDVGVERVSPHLPLMEWEGAPYVHRPSAHLLAPQSLEMERTLVGVRLQLAQRYAAENGLNPITRDDPGAGLGIVACGLAHELVSQALGRLGAPLPVRVLKLGMPYPLDTDAVRAFAAGLDEVLVVEEKGPWLERLVKDALYGMPAAPTITGERDDRGHALVPPTGALGPDDVLSAVGRRLLAREELPEMRALLEHTDAAQRRSVISIGAARTPHFCSGCPHSTSTRTDDEVVVGAGIGCHTMVMLQGAGRGAVHGVTQMGGEGAQWIGIAPFVERRHFVQNLGDGTFHHSGSLAIRAAVAARIDVTYKLLYNETVAMTGGQHPQGQMTIPAVVRSLLADGVARVVVTSDDPSRLRGLPDGVAVLPRERLAQAERELRDVAGVSVLIHEQPCATELRRARKRGRAPEPPQQVLINERVCEGCGDCGEKSGCLSVEPVATEFGRKTRIHQSSCNKDFSCLQGDCPSFLTVIPAEGGRRPAPRLPDIALPEPVSCVPRDDARIRLVGIGGTGVVTVSQVLSVAAMVDGRMATGLDQTGLSQKAGPVSSDVRIGDGDLVGAAQVGAGDVDALLGFDVVATATKAQLAVADAQRTVAVVSTSVVPTAQMVLDASAPAPDLARARRAIDAATRCDDNVYLDAQALALAVFDDHMPANMIVLGAAWQRGLIPLSREALREALRLNRTAVDVNLAAFEWGRAAVAAPQVVADVITPPVEAPRLRAADHALVDRVAGSDPELRRLAEIRVADLVRWGGRRVARRYADALEELRAVEHERLGDSTAITQAAARQLHKLLAYKDEYEVAALHLELLRDLPKGTKAKVHLHPPLLRAVGMDRKLELGRWFVPGLWALRAGRHVRGGPLDVFGRTEMRRLERALPDEYLDLLRPALACVTPATRATVIELAELPDTIRGYEDIKLEGVARFRARAAQLTAALVLGS